MEQAMELLCRIVVAVLAKKWAVLPALLTLLLAGCGTQEDGSLPKAATQLKDKQYAQALETLQGMEHTTAVSFLRGRALLGQGAYDQAAAAFRAGEAGLDQFATFEVQQAVNEIYLRHLGQLLESRDPAGQEQVSRLVKAAELAGHPQVLVNKLRQAVTVAAGDPEKQPAPEVSVQPVAEEPGIKDTMAALRRIAVSMSRFVTIEDEIPQRAYPVSHASDRSMRFAELMPQLFEGDRTIAHVDGWGSPLTYCSNGEVYIVVSPGKDAAYERDACYYLDQPGAKAFSDPEKDIVMGNGHFISYPQGF